MKRRTFISLLGAAAAWPVAARAQQAAAMPVIGFLNSASSRGFAHYVAAYHAGLKETGYAEGHNVAIEYRWAEGQYHRLLELAAGLVQRQVAVIAATGSAPSALAAKAATTKIPIVFVAGDPLRVGLVTSLSRPSGNITGISPFGYELEGKKLEILSEVLPRASVIAILTNPNGQNAARQLQDIEGAARTLGRRIAVVTASTERQLESAFMTIIQQHAGAVLVGADPFFVSQSREIAALAARHAVPAIMYERSFTAAGGLMSYGASLVDSYRLAGVYTGRILKGEKPTDLPVQQPTKVELIINLKTAKALGLDVPPTLLARADEVIE